MKNSLISIGIFLAIILSACTPDACKDVNCLNGGVCETGDCICAIGFEGTNCQTEQRQAFVGNYSVDEACNLGDFSYEISINADSEIATQITLSNIADLGFELTGSVDGVLLTIPEQTVNNYTTSGSGELEEGTLTLEYVLVTSQGQTLTCSLTCDLID